MPILFQINVSLNTGSIGRIVEDIGAVAQSQGWDVWVAHGPRYVNNSSLKTYQICSRGEELLHVVQTRLLDGYGLGCTLATRRLVEKIEEIKPDVIHLHNIHGYYLDIRVLFSFLKKANIPVVWSIHDCWSFTGHCAHFDVVGCQRWKVGCYDCPRKRKFPQSYLLERSQRNYELKKALFTSVPNLTLVPVSNWLKGLLEDSFFYNCSNVEMKTIYNGANLSSFSPCGNDLNIQTQKKYGIEGKFVAIALASKWGNEKGWSDYLRLSQILPNDMMVILVGVSKEQKRMLPQNIIGVERTDSIQELVTLYSMSDVLLSLSILETFGLTVVEGYACGIPAIVYDRTASPEMVSEDTGYVVSAGNVYEVVDCMRKIQSKGRYFYRDKCRKKAEQQFNVVKQYQMFVDLYCKKIAL